MSLGRFLRRAIRHYPNGNGQNFQIGDRVYHTPNYAFSGIPEPPINERPQHIGTVIGIDDDSINMAFNRHGVPLNNLDIALERQVQQIYDQAYSRMREEDEAYSRMREEAQGVVQRINLNTIPLGEDLHVNRSDIGWSDPLSLETIIDGETVIIIRGNKKNPYQIPHLQEWLNQHLTDPLTREPITAAVVTKHIIKINEDMGNNPRMGGRRRNKSRRRHRSRRKNRTVKR